MSARAMAWARDQTTKTTSQRLPFSELRPQGRMTLGRLITAVLVRRRRAIRRAIRRERREEALRLSRDILGSDSFQEALRKDLQELRHHDMHAATLPPGEAQAYFKRVQRNAEARREIAMGTLDPEEHAATLPPVEGEAFLKAHREREERLREEWGVRLQKIQDLYPDDPMYEERLARHLCGPRLRLVNYGPRFREPKPRRFLVRLVHAHREPPPAALAAFES